MQHGRLRAGLYFFVVDELFLGVWHVEQSTKQAPGASSPFSSGAWSLRPGCQLEPCPLRLLQAFVQGCCPASGPASTPVSQPPAASLRRPPDCKRGRQGSGWRRWKLFLKGFGEKNIRGVACGASLFAGHPPGLPPSGHQRAQRLWLRCSGPGSGSFLLGGAAGPGLPPFAAFSQAGANSSLLFPRRLVSGFPSTTPTLPLRSGS